MRAEEFVGAVTWHLECMELALNGIDALKPQADAHDIRMQHSIYLINFMSVVEIIRECHGDRFLEALKKGLETSNRSGKDVLGYARELRNSIVHRGENPARSALVIEDVVRVVAPARVQNRGGSCMFDAPDFLLADIFCHLETRAKPVFEAFLESSISQLETITQDDLMGQTQDAVRTNPIMPNWGKVMALATVGPDTLVEFKANRVQKLRELLRPAAGKSSD